MKKLVSILTLMSLVVCFQAVGLDVDEAELSVTKDTVVEFINYEGPHSKIETLDEILGIGTYLGEAVKSGAMTATYAGKYRVIHAVGESVDQGLDADIFIVLGPAEVDHIRNLRYMIAGFLMAAYDYETSDALLLAEFVTVYNAVYRGKMDFFGGKYKQIVTRNLDPLAAGISTLYSDWPGKTQMVIPLTEDAANGGLGSLNTDVITDDQVIGQMRTQEDMGLDSRKGVTELKEREVEQKQQQLEEERQAVDTERQRIADERQRIQEERTQAEQQQEAATTDAERTRAAEQQQALDQQEQALDQQEQSVDQREQDLAQQEQQQADRIDRIQQEREQIAADERTLMEQQTEGETVAAATGARRTSRVVVFLDVRDLNGEPLGRLVHIDSGSGAILQATTLNTIRNRRFVAMGPSYVVVAGTTAGQGAVRLMTVTQESLETGREGTDDIYEGSFLLADGSSVYAVTGSPGAWKLGRFDTTLVLRQTSEIDVYENTSISLMGDTLFVVGSDAQIHMLAKTDLTETGVVQ